jgi:hypothetical protein
MISHALDDSHVGMAHAASLDGSSAPGRAGLPSRVAATGRREAAALAAAGLMAAASNLPAVHAVGWASMNHGTAATPLDMVFGGVFGGLIAAVDGMVAAYLAACFLAIQRPNVLACVLAAVLAAAPIVCSAAKLAVVGGPGLFGDVLLLADLARDSDRATAAVAGCLVFAAAAAFAFNMRLARPGRVFLDLLPLALIGSLAVAACHSPGLAARLAALAPMNVSGFPGHGHVLNALAELATDLDRRHAIDAARESGRPPPPAAIGHVPPLERRSVHLVVVESLMDPTWLTGFAFSPEPLSPLFARWREHVGSTAVVPVFGNRSVNTGFEILCGLPASVGPSEVVYRLVPAAHELPCLPRALAAQGFRTIATRVTSPAFYNGGTALAAAGFQERVFAADLDMSDRDGHWLSAEATLRQAERRAASLAAEGGAAPVFNYVVLAAGHYPYDRDKARRPDRVSVAPGDALIQDYVNGAHYNAVAVEDFVNRTTEADPRALIVVLGDHQPLLGPNYRGYRAGGRLPPEDDAPPLHRAAMFETPLLVLDGSEAVPLGRLPAYLLPEVILDRLSGGEYCRRNDACEHRKPWRLRPFRDHAMEVEAHGRGERFCPTRTETLAEAAGLPCAAAAARSRAWDAALFRALGGPSRPAAHDHGG